MTTFKGEIKLILQKLFQKTEEENILLNSFSELKTEKKKKLYKKIKRQISLRKRVTKSQ